MKLSCRLFSVLAIIAVLAASIATFAEPSTPPTTQTPNLIVYARTDLANQGAPTLDLLDLERYFVQTLTARAISANVVPSSTARIPAQPALDYFDLEVSVDAMQAAERAAWNEELKRYDGDRIFNVELSISVKQLRTGKLLGLVRSQRTYHFRNYDEAQELAPKRATIYAAADQLVDNFLQASTAGRFGKQLSSLKPPPPQSPPRGPALPGLVLPQWAYRRWTAFLGGAFSLLLLMLLVAVFTRTPKGSSAPVSRATVIPAPPRKPKPDYAAWDAELTSAFALALKTDTFSEPACQAAAAASHDAILATHSHIEAKEAERQLTAKRREAHYEELATRAAASSGLDMNQVIDILRKADAWEFRVLQAAKKLAVEVSK